METPPKTPFASLLTALVQPDDTLLALLMRSRPTPCRTGLPLLDLLNGGAGLGTGDVVELCGDAGSGKSAVLLHAVARLLAATEPLRSGSLDGALRAGARVALFSLDGRFCANALALTVAAALAREEEGAVGYAAPSGPAAPALFASSPLRALAGSRGGAGGQAAALPAPPAATPAPPVRALQARLRGALARVDVHCPPSGPALVEALEALAASAAPLALLALDGMSSPWHWSARLYGGSRGADDLHARLASALERTRAHTRCRVLWTRPTLFGRVDPALRAPAAAGGPGPAAALSAASALAECAADEAGGLGGVRRPTLNSSMPALTLPALVSEGTLLAASSDTLTGALGGMVTHRVLLTRLRCAAAAGAGAGAARGGQGGSQEGAAPTPDLAALAAVSTSASAATAVLVEVPAGAAQAAGRRRHPKDPAWLQALDASQASGSSAHAEATFHVALVAARMATAEGVKESILCLCA